MVPENDRARFKKRLLPVAEKIREEFGIPPDITITQAAHESNWGESQLARAAHNLFGVTVTESWIKNGREVYSVPSREYSKFPPEKIRYWNREGDIIDKRPDGHGGSILMVEIKFRKYKSWDESLDDWAGKIINEERYSKAYFYAKLGDTKEFFDELQKAGYATDPKYSDKLMGVYNVVSGLKIEDTQAFA